jgi:hypothetical protein
VPSGRHIGALFIATEKNIMKLTRFSLVSSVVALSIAPQMAFAQPAPAAPLPAPAPAAPAPAAPAPAAPAPAETPPPPAPEPPPTAAAPEAAPAPDAESTEELPKKLAVGKEGFFQPAALLQFWLWNQNRRGDDALTFRIRRAELRIKGEIVPELVGYMIMIDPARALEFENKDLEVEGQEPAPDAPGSVTASQPNGATTILQDFNISFLSQYADVTVGQFKIPVSYEGFNSSSKILFPERALVSRQYGDRRDIGLKVEKKLFDDYFYYNIGLYNGTGQNRLDNDDQKDVGLRLEGYPYKGVTLGAVGYMGVGERDTANTKDRIEGDLKIEMFNALLLAEYIHAWDGPTDADRLEGAGFYVAGGYTFLERIQPIVRIGKLDTNVNGNATGSSDEVWAYEGGFNYYLRGQEMRLAMTASFFDYKTEPTKTDVTLFAQVNF